MGRIPYFLASLASSIPKAHHRALRSLLRVSGSILRAIAWAMMVGVVSGEEQPNTPERCSGWWQSSTERSGGDRGVVCKKEGYLNPQAPRR